ncbi:hypothetical protein KAH37_00145 [bacterium]|nr:hypothetical protein [bacterium]
MRVFTVILLVLLLQISLVAESLSAKSIVRDRDGVFSIEKLSIPVERTPLAVRNLLITKLNGRLNLNEELIPHFKAGYGPIENSILKFDYSYKDIPVSGRYTVVTLSNGKVIKVASAVENIELDVKNLLPLNGAVKDAQFARFGKELKSTPKIYSKTIIMKWLGSYRVVYKVSFTPTSLADGRFYLVDAHTGEYFGGGNSVRNAEPTNMAKVFETNPLRNPEPIEVELPWVADDKDGFLTSAEGSDGLRRIVATNCLDEGEKVAAPDGSGDIPICTPRQVANKDINGSFIYEDWDKGVQQSFDIDDVYAEVSMYYHASKIYKYLLSLGTEEFDYLAAHQMDKDAKKPLIVVGNFQFPARSGGLAPMDNAFFSPESPQFNDLFFKNFPYQGSLLVFGQGTKTDFGYDGDVVYHEFGHAVVETAGPLSALAFPDRYGFTMESMSINEGFADTFSFLMTEDECLGEYASVGMAAQAQLKKNSEGFYCMRNAVNDKKANENFTGESHHDGLSMLATHWEVYHLALDKGLTKDDFSRLFLRTLYSIPTANLYFERYARLFMDQVDSDTKFSPFKDEIRAIFEKRNFFEKVRARDIIGKFDYIMIGGIIAPMGAPKASFKVDTGDRVEEISPAYVQFYYDVPECTDTLKITAQTQATQTYTTQGPKLELYVREGQHLDFMVDDFPITVKVDSIIQDEGGWNVTGLTPGKRYYMQFVNKAGDGVIYSMNLKEEWNSEAECTVEEQDDSEITDSEISDDETSDSETSDSDNSEQETSTKSDGCSLLII